MSLANLVKTLSTHEHCSDLRQDFLLFCCLLPHEKNLSEVQKITLYLKNNRVKATAYSVLKESWLVDYLENFSTLNEEDKRHILGTQAGGSIQCILEKSTQTAKVHTLFEDVINVRLHALKTEGWSDGERQELGNKIKDFLNNSNAVINNLSDAHQGLVIFKLFFRHHNNKDDLLKLFEKIYWWSPFFLLDMIKIVSKVIFKISYSEMINKVLKMNSLHVGKKGYGKGENLSSVLMEHSRENDSLLVIKIALVNYFKNCEHATSEDVREFAVLLTKTNNVTEAFDCLVKILDINTGNTFVLGHFIDPQDLISCREFFNTHKISHQKTELEHQVSAEHGHSKVLKI